MSLAAIGMQRTTIFVVRGQFSTHCSAPLATVAAISFVATLAAPPLFVFLLRIFLADR